MDKKQIKRVHSIANIMAGGRRMRHIMKFEPSDPWFLVQAWHHLGMYIE